VERLVGEMNLLLSFIIKLNWGTIAAEQSVEIEKLQKKKFFTPRLSPSVASVSYDCSG
jgi:hypothetical protein